MSLEEDYKGVTLTPEEEKLLKRLGVKTRMCHHHQRLAEKYLEQVLSLECQLEESVEERMKDA